MAGRLEVTRVEPGDGALFDRIAPDVFDAPIAPRRLAAYLANATHLLVVAIAGGEIVGQCAGVIHLHPDKAPELFIDEVGVTPAMRNQGIARRMMEELAAWGAEQGCEEAWLGTEPDNDAANALYVRFAEPEPILMYYWEL